MIVTLLAVCTLLAPVRAQEGDGYRETFDDPTLPNWEHSREAIVADGVLRMSPGNFALRGGDWSDVTLSIKVRYSGPGGAIVGYYFRDEGRYAVLLEEGIVVLEKEVHQSPTQLGNAQVPGGQHEVYVNDETDRWTTGTSCSS